MNRQWGAPIGDANDIGAWTFQGEVGEAESNRTSRKPGTTPTNHQGLRSHPIPEPNDEPEWLKQIPEDERYRRFAEAMAITEPDDMSTAGKTWNVLRSAIRKFAVRDEDRIFQIANRVFNSRCTPPWDEKRFREKCSQALHDSWTPEWGVGHEEYPAARALLGKSRTNDTQESAGDRGARLPTPAEDESAVDPDFCVILRGRFQKAKDGIKFKESTIRGSLCKALEHDSSAIDDPQIQWPRKSRDSAVALVLSSRDLAPSMPTVNELRDFMVDALPRPAFLWTTSKRIYAVFVGDSDRSAVGLAGIWYLYGPLGEFASWRCQLKTAFPQPTGTLYQFAEASAELALPGNPYRRVTASVEQIDEFLAAVGVANDGGRFTVTASTCPLGGCDETPSDDAPIIADENGLRCFDCGRFESYDKLTGVVGHHGRPSPHEAAKAFVHIDHQRLVLREQRPEAPDELINAAWKLSLNIAHAEELAELATDIKSLKEAVEALRAAEIDEKQITRFKALLKHLDELGCDLRARIWNAGKRRRVGLVRSSMGVWLDSPSLLPVKIDKQSAREIPSVFSGLDAARAANATVPLRGFVNIHPINASFAIAPFARPPERAIYTRRPKTRDEGPEIDLSIRPTAEQVEKAWATVERYYHGIDRGYVSTVVVAGFASQGARLQVPVIVVTGPTGSGKTTEQKIGAAMVGGQVASVQLGDTKDTLRKIGLGLERGASHILIDESGRTKDVYTKLEPILGIQNSVTFEAKYRNEVTAPMTAPMTFAGSTLAVAIVKAPEIERRAVGFRLIKAVDWKKPAECIRSDEAIRPAFDIITADLWWRVHDEGPEFDWKAFCVDMLGAQNVCDLDLDDEGGAFRVETIRTLYTKYRTVPESHCFPAGARFAGWLDVSEHTAAGKVLGELIDPDEVQKAWFAQASDIFARTSMNEIIGVREPPIEGRLRRHGATIALKFAVLGVRKGEEPRRQDLPPLDFDCNPNETEAGGDGETSGGADGAGRVDDDADAGGLRRGR